MKVSELPYRRVTIEEVTSVMEDVIARVRSAASADEILTAREDARKILLEYQTNTALAYMRYSINTVGLPLPCRTGGEALSGAV